MGFLVQLCCSPSQDPVRIKCFFSFGSLPSIKSSSTNVGSQTSRLFSPLGTSLNSARSNHLYDLNSTVSPRRNKHAFQQWYCISKTLAEHAAWRFAEEHGIDLVVMNPGFVLGLLHQPTLNQTSKFILEIIKGKFELPSYQFVDVKDVARAHIAAFENSSANGRYLLVGKSLSHPEALQLLHKLYPSINCPINATATESEIQTLQISKSRTESLGVSFMPLEVSLKDTIESLKEKNFLTL